MKESIDKRDGRRGLEVLFIIHPDEFVAYLNMLSSRSCCFCLVTEGNFKCVIADEELSLTSLQLHLFFGKSINLLSSENFKCYIISGIGIFFPPNNVLRDRPVHNLWTLSKSEFKMLRSCFQGTLRKTHSENTIVLLMIISALNAYYQESLPHSDSGISSRRITLFHKFSNLVIEHFNQQHSVRFYADNLCITPGYLTKVVCAISSLSPKEFILRYIIFEAKAMLLKSDITVEAVAEQLGFTDASAFSALFKKHTGRSPKDFRMQNFKI